MKITIQSIHFDADKKLQQFIEEKCNKLPHYFEAILEATVYLKVEKNAQAENKTVEIKLAVPSNTLMASQHAKTFEEGTDMCIEQLKRQLVKHKEKLRSM